MVAVLSPDTPVTLACIRVGVEVKSSLLFVMQYVLKVSIPNQFWSVCKQFVLATRHMILLCVLSLLNLDMVVLRFVRIELSRLPLLP